MPSKQVTLAWEGTQPLAPSAAGLTQAQRVSNELLSKRLTTEIFTRFSVEALE